MLSIGRAQTPTLALVVNRQHEIEHFVPKDTWELKTLYRDVLFTSLLKPFETEESGRRVFSGEVAEYPLEDNRCHQEDRP